MLTAIYCFIGQRASLLAAGLAAIWFTIALVLLTRPPGLPEFVSEEPGSDEQYVIRRDVLPKLPLTQRFSLAMTVACGACLLLWLSLTILAR
jgi:hypothetical protein